MAVRLFIFLFAMFLLVTSREPPWADARAVYDTTQALVNHGQLSVPAASLPWFYAHRNGRAYGVFPLGNVVAMIPSYLSFGALRLIPGIPTEPLFAFTCHVSPALLMAGAGALFYLLCRRRGAPPGWSVLLTLALGFATICFCYARSPYAEALQTFAMVLLVERTLAQGERMSAGGMAGLGAAAGLLFNSKLVYALVLPLAPLYLLYIKISLQRPARWRTLIAGFASGLLGFAPLLGIALWHNWLKTGSIFDTGYKSLASSGLFDGDLAAGLFGLTLSSGKSLFLYSPPLVLGLLGLRTALQRLALQSWFLIAVSAVVLLFNAKFTIWHGDYCWGPRYVTPITPLLLLLAIPWLPQALARGQRRLRLLALAALLAFGVYVQVLGAALYWDHYIRILLSMKNQTGAAGWFEQQVGHGHFIPEFSPLRGHLWMLRHMYRDNPNLQGDAPWLAHIAKPVDLSDTWRRLRIDFWALDWVRGQGPGQGKGTARSKAFALSLFALLGGAALGSALSLRRQLRRS